MTALGVEARHVLQQDRGNVTDVVQAVVVSQERVTPGIDGGGEVQCVDEGHTSLGTNASGDVEVGRRVLANSEEPGGGEEASEPLLKGRVSCTVGAHHHRGDDGIPDRRLEETVASGMNDAARCLKLGTFTAQEVDRHVGIEVDRSAQDVGTAHEGDPWTVAGVGARSQRSGRSEASRSRAIQESTSSSVDPQRCLAIPA